ncbi:hypothetical protein [Sandarakinorhabdus sp. DWP1-3-1]|uniref:hypothetical protein n=1 Tax=Sandarakinorhabdus sp. DWP1-3-1 TaxID=2804627 RepID=UPI003CF789A6
MDNHSLLAEIEAFQARHSMADSTFGRLAVNDWKFLRSLREGKRRLWPETIAKVRKFMEEYAPAPAGDATSEAAAA